MSVKHKIFSAMKMLAVKTQMVALPVYVIQVMMVMAMQHAMVGSTILYI